MVKCFTGDKVDVDSAQSVAFFGRYVFVGVVVVCISSKSRVGANRPINSGLNRCMDGVTMKHFTVCFICCLRRKKNCGGDSTSLSAAYIVK